MSNIGIGVLYQHPFGVSGCAPEEFYGHTIINAEILDDKLTITFDDNTIIDIWDSGQSCCEHRYMRTDDNVADLIGKRLTKIETKQATSQGNEYSEHEIVFLEITAENEWITISNHNEHNGFYGGFVLIIEKR